VALLSRAEAPTRGHLSNEPDTHTLAERETAVGIGVLRDGDRVLVRADPRATDEAWSPLKIFKVRSA
jgi:hypothetical protein